ncbi:MAG: hypothetical protein M3O78_06555, partial [Chloroflexota bacterium]|nr:hypothetical protein [Chloroflexota bacterium]
MEPGRTEASGQGGVPKPGVRHIAFIAGLVLVACLTGCAAAGKGSHSTSLSPTQEPTPSATPFDVVSAFVGKLADGLSAEATVSGTIDVGSVHGTLGGSYTFGTDGNYAYEITTIVGESQSVSRGVVLNGTTYSRDANGPWLQEAPATSGGAQSGGFEQLTAQVSSVRDTGIVTFGGSQVHSLQAPGGLTVPASALGISDPNVHDPHASVDFFAFGDGTPAGMALTMTWTQGSAATAQDAKMVMDLAFTTFGSTIVVQPPNDVWQAYTSKQQHFTVAYPGDWQAKGDAVSVSFTAPDQSAYMWIGLGAESKQLDQKAWTNDVVA